MGKTFIFDSHLHLRQLLQVNPLALETFLHNTNYHAVVSCHDEEDFKAVSALESLNIKPSFGIHPQWPVTNYQDLLFDLAKNHKIVAVGEAGWDFFDEHGDAIEQLQTGLFKLQVEIARTYELPLIIHLRKATHMIFKYRKELSQVPAVMFHSWPGPEQEAVSILKHKINGYFSFGTPILWNAHKAHRTIQILGPHRIFSETDSPYQPIRGRDYTDLKDIHQVNNKILELLQVSLGQTYTAEDLEKDLYTNWTAVFGGRWNG